ncbi:hypothetical protein N8510_01225 [bacterium]|nr:hypothetical protein [bacterium]
MQLKVRPKQKITADYMNAIVDRLPKDQAGYAVGGLAMSRSTVQVLNSTGANRDLGDLVSLGSFGSRSTVFDAVDSIELTASSPTWHTSIATVGVLAEPIPDGERGACVVQGFCIVKLSAALTTGHTHVFVDPSATTEAKSSYSGFARVLSDATAGGDDFALVCIGDRCDLWRYTLTQDSQASNATTATLKDRRGNTFGDINLLDPLSLMSDQESGDDGWCINCGNDFEAIQGPCS